jgi:hypothetical protein
MTQKSAAVEQRTSAGQELSAQAQTGGSVIQALREIMH